MGRLETCLNRESPTALTLNWLVKAVFLSQKLNTDDESAYNSSEENKPVNKYIDAGGNPVLKRLLPRQKPGLYMIRCDINDKRYYGESSNVSARLNSHRSLLKQGIHPCKKLQQDWINYGEAKFDFIPLYLGQSWNNRAVRLQKESFLIKTDRSRCYNLYSKIGRPGKENGFYGKNHSEITKEAIGGSQRGIPKEKLGKKIILDGESYPSISEASRATNHARKTIRAWLEDPKNSRCIEEK